MSGFSPFEPGTLSGRVALVTGAGGGIGAAVARRLASLGARLVLADLRSEPLERTRAELGETETLCWAGDLTIEPLVKELFQQIQERYGRLDIAVNAAGIVRATPFEELAKSEWDEVVNANAGSAFLVCRECCGPMKRQGWGRIINFSSMAGQLGGVVAGAHYAAAKSAVISLTRSVARHLAPHGVRCNAIAPAGVETEMLTAFSDEQRARLIQSSPLGRLAAAEEIAELVAWLASPASDFITGQTININGGAYLG